MEKSRAIELLKLAVPIKALTQQEYSDFVEAVNMGMDALEQPTSPDTIDRQAAIDALQKCRKHCIDPFDSYHIDIQDAENQLMKLPSVQPERKKGEWIEISSINHTYKCSECGRLLVNVADGRNNVSKHYPYCHCGADMKGEPNE